MANKFVITLNWNIGYICNVCNMTHFFLFHYYLWFKSSNVLRVLFYNSEYAKFFNTPRVQDVVIYICFASWANESSYCCRLVVSAYARPLIACLTRLLFWMKSQMKAALACVISFIWIQNSLCGQYQIHVLCLRIQSIFVARSKILVMNPLHEPTA